MAGTYEELQTEIAAYLGRTDLTDKIPSFIKFAEADMNRELRLKIMEREAYTFLVPKQSAIPLPDKRVFGDWDVFLEMRDLRLNGEFLENLDYLGLKNIPQRKDAGRPYAYSIRGRELVFVPTPDLEYEVLMTYYAEIPPLGDDQPANDVLLRSPDLYLYGSLLASVPYARSSVPSAMWEAFYRKAADSMNKSDISGRFTANLAAKPIRSVV